MRISSLIIFAALTLSACGDDSDPTATAPGAFQADFKTSASFFTNMSRRVVGTSPHGAQQTWYSTNIRSTIGQSTFTVPEGTVAIKEFDMMNDGTADAYAVMVKKAAGYDSAHQDWYYEMRMLDGTVMVDPPAGKTQMCIDCHQAYSQTDFLAATALR